MVLLTTPSLPPLSRFPDVQRVLADGLAFLAGGLDHSDIKTPDNLERVLPFIRVRRIGGPRDVVNDHPTVEIDVFDKLYADVERLAETVSQYLCGPPPPFWQFDSVECDPGPRELPWGDTALIRRFGATYHITSRRRGLIT